MGDTYMPSGCGLLAAGFWDDLCLYPADLGSAVTLADVTTNGHRHCVIEYKDAGFRSGGATTNNLVSFQLVFEEGVSNRFRVFYRNVGGYGDGRSATLGRGRSRRRSSFHAKQRPSRTASRWNTASGSAPTRSTPTPTTTG